MKKKFKIQLENYINCNKYKVLNCSKYFIDQCLEYKKYDICSDKMIRPTQSTFSFVERISVLKQLLLVFEKMKGFVNA